jgi:hypothetical protein
MYTEIWWEIIKERDHLEGLAVRLEDNIKMNLKGIG